MDKKIRGMRVLESGAGQREDFGGGIKGRALELPCIAEDADDHTGFGAFATVALCRHKVDGSDYAVKKIPTGRYVSFDYERVRVHARALNYGGNLSLTKIDGKI
ncbi:hypothetical protein ACFX19_041924 [Malus domestica]